MSLSITITDNDGVWPRVECGLPQCITNVGCTFPSGSTSKISSLVLAYAPASGSDVSVHLFLCSPTDLVDYKGRVREKIVKWWRAKLEGRCEWLVVLVPCEVSEATANEAILAAMRAEFFSRVHDDRVHAWGSKLEVPLKACVERHFSQTSRIIEYDLSASAPLEVATLLHLRSKYLTLLTAHCCNHEALTNLTQMELICAGEGLYQAPLPYDILEATGGGKIDPASIFAWKARLLMALGRPTEVLARGLQIIRELLHGPSPTDDARRWAVEQVQHLVGAFRKRFSDIEAIDKNESITGAIKALDDLLAFAVEQLLGLGHTPALSAAHVWSLRARAHPHKRLWNSRLPSVHDLGQFAPAPELTRLVRDVFHDTDFGDTESWTSGPVGFDLVVTRVCVTS
jgi:hypothetical protein